MARPAASQFIRGTLDALQPFGVDIVRLGLHNRLEQALQQGRALQLSDTLNTIWTEAVRATRDPLLGLKAAACTHPAKLFGLLYHRAQAAETLGEALQLMARHILTLFPAEAFEVERHAGLLHICAQVPGACNAVPLQRYDFGAVCVLRACQLLLGETLRPTAVHYPCAGPADLTAHRHAFGIVPRFDEPGMRLVLPVDQFERTLPSSHRTIARLLDTLLCGQATTPLGSTAAMVERQVLLQLRDGTPSRRSVAERLAMTERTLQRRLAEEHTSFAQLLDQTRRALALQHMAQGRATLAEIGYELGFGDRSSFYKAWRRWFGCTPPCASMHEPAVVSAQCKEMQV